MVEENGLAECTKHQKGAIYFHTAGFYGFGYPPGYRPQKIFDICAEGKYFVLLAVGGSSLGLQKIDFDGGEVRLYVNCAEFCYRDVERVLSAYFKKDLKWAAGEKISEQEEMKQWAEDQKRDLEELANGAQPYGLGFANGFFENDKTGMKNEILEGLKKDPAFKKTSIGWVKKAAKVVDMPQPALDELVLKYAAEKKIGGAVYVSNGSWPLPIQFVADGKRYASHAAFDADGKEIFIKDRAWLAYYEDANIARILPQGHNILIKSGRPDILPALRKIRD